MKSYSSKNQRMKWWFVRNVVCCLTIACPAIGLAESNSESDANKPNIILISMDDLGYGDLGCYGAKKQQTPVIDQMAKDGMRFTHFYSTSGVCTPSRASLLTGCYPRRLNLHVDENGKWVLFPVAKKGLHPDEVTFAEVLKSQGYATACIGKWHLGDQPEFLPTRQGFDYYFGIPYSNDMHRQHAPLPLLKNETVIEAPVTQPTITTRYTDEAIEFIEQHSDQPFLVYLPHTSVHLPLFPGKAFLGKSDNGAYGDWIEEVDASTDRIMKTLDRLKLTDNTLVIFTSDNGSNQRNGGSNAPLKGKKGSTDEGGMRVPCIMRWPKKIPANSTCDQLASTLDMLPTFAHFAGATLSNDRVIDGHDIHRLMFAEPGAASPHEAFFYYHTDQLQAVRRDQWKLVLPQKSKRIGWSGKKENTKLQLFDVVKDPREKNDLAQQHPDVVQRLQAFAEAARKELGDFDQPGSGQRKAGWVADPVPLMK